LTAVWSRSNCPPIVLEKDMNVLLTGAAGLIGMAVRPVLSARGHRVVPIDITDFGRGDSGLKLVPLHDRKALDALIQNESIDAVIHCAAISGPMMAKGQPMKFVAANIDATALLLDLAREHHLRRFVFCSSISVYGDVGKGLITETTQLRPTSIYGATKVASEQLIQGFAMEYGVSGVSLRISRVYGPYRRANCHLNSLIRDSEEGVETQIPCDPAFVYHYIYVDDVAEAILSALEAKELPHREYNVASGEAMTMPTIVEAVTAANPKMRCRLISGVDDVPDVQTAFDISRIAEDLGWKPRFRIGAGVAAYREAILAGRSA
jgi:UDP-glucuronate 4-epimerase